MKYIASWSGGKDSTATIILAHENNEPLDTIIFCEVMFSEHITGEIPEKIDFVRNVAKPLFESWGYEVIILHHNKTFLDNFYHVRGKRSKWCGKRLGFPMAGKCYMNDAKREPIKKFYREIKGEYTDYVGIAIDEKERLERMAVRNCKQVSLLAKYGYTEQMAKKKCEEYGLLSPVYEFSKRDGCWFCPNAAKCELRNLWKNHKELWNELVRLENEENIIGDKFDTRGGKSIKEWEEIFKQEAAQMTIFDFI